MNGILILKPLDRETWSIVTQLSGLRVPQIPFRPGLPPRLPLYSVYLYLAFKTILSWWPTFIRSSLGSKLKPSSLWKPVKSGTKIALVGHHLFEVVCCCFHCHDLRENHHCLLYCVTESSMSIVSLFALRTEMTCAMEHKSSLNVVASLVTARDGG